MNNLTEASQPSYQDEETSIDLRKYLALFLQWWWLILITALLAAGAAYYFSLRITPLYRSTTTLMVNEAPINRGTDYSSMVTSERLAQTYALMMTKRPVIEEVIKRLDINYTPAQLQGMVTVKPVSGTQLMTITVESSDMNLAPAVGNMLVVVFTEQIQESQSLRFAASKESLQAQIADAEARLAQTREERRDTNRPSEVARLTTQLNQYEQIYTDLVMTYEQIRTTEAQSASNVEQLEKAEVNPYPVNMNVMQNTLMAAVVGMMLAVGGIFVFDMLDDTIKTPDDIRHKLNLSILGTIPRFDEPEDGRLIAQALPRSPVTESFRALRLNVQYASVDKPLRTLIVTSPTPSDGKTTVASNLAVVMSKTGKRVTIIDADLHRPRVHFKFKTNFQPGLSSIFISPLMHLNGTFQETAFDSLHVVSAGELPPNPSELLGSKKMLEIIDLVLEKSDLVIIDTPPILSVTDALVLAPSVDGVLLVVKPGVTKHSMLQAMLEQLRNVGANVIGVVVNGVDEKNPRYGYYYKSYSYKSYKQYGSDEAKGRAAKKAEKQKETELAENGE